MKSLALIVAIGIGVLLWRAYAPAPTDLDPTDADSDPVTGDGGVFQSIADAFGTAADATGFGQDLPTPDTIDDATDAGESAAALGDA